MIVLIAGLVLFLGVHFTRALMPATRDRIIAERGDNAWKLGYTIVSLVGFGLIIWGYGMARDASQLYWVAPDGLRPVVWLVMLAAFILVIAGNGPRSHIRAIVKHPMTIGVLLWSGAHLVINGDSAALLLFGSFLVWSIVLAASAYRRPVPTDLPAPAWVADAVAIIVGGGLWVLFLVWGHLYLFGVSPY
ncbi:MAG: NnrU family protein [Pseudomonadota bacterium]